MEKIKFQDVLAICEEYIKQPQNTDTAKKYNDLETGLIIRSFMPMQEKVVTLFKMVIDSDKSVDIPASAFTATLELAGLFDGLLAYTNIDCDAIPSQLKIYENYDLIYQSGLADYILRFCDRDYRRLLKMLDRTMSYEHLLQLINSISAMDSTAISEATREFRKFRDETDPAVLKDVADIARLNDPHLYELKESLVDDALEQIKRADKLDKM